MRVPLGNSERKIMPTKLMTMAPKKADQKLATSKPGPGRRRTEA